jgi:filamentous hemagglutinin family protein
MSKSFRFQNKEVYGLGSALKLPLGVLLGAASLMLNAAPANQLPTAPTVTAGQTSISQAGNRLTINQTTKFASVNWDSFSIGKDAAVSINMPSSDSISLQRVTGTASTVIAGQLTSNGRVFLSNPAGVLFAKGARVDTAAILATTKDITDWNADRTSVKLIGDSSASVLNEGTLKVTDGGFVILAAAKVINKGNIEAQLGNVALAAGDTIELNFGGNSSLSVSITKGHLDALVSNRDAIIADGGKVILTAKGAENAANSVVNNSGLIRAQSIQNKNGRIYLVGDGTTEVDGTLDASAPAGGNGGFIETSAPQLRVAPAAMVTTFSKEGKTGTWLLDPTDFSVTNGTSPLSINGIGNTTLSDSLNLNNVEITSASVGAGISNIYIEAPVSWTAATNLKLSANNSIYINAPITVSNAGGSLSLEFGLGAVAAGNINDYYAYAPVNLPAGNSFTTKLGSDGLTNTFRVVTQLGTFGDTSGTTLQGLQPYLNSYPPYGFVAIGSDIDATATASWDNNRGFLPLDMGSAREIAGLGHRINGLHISRNSASNVGLFSVSYGIIKDLGITNGYISGSLNVGPISGDGRSTAFINCFTSNCKVVSNAGGSAMSAGGLAGMAYYISQCYAENVEVWALSGERAGGLTGATATNNPGSRVGDFTGGLITDSWSSGIVHGSNKLGGLVGVNFGHISNSYSVAYVFSDYTGRYDVGGLIGQNWYGSASGCYSMSNIYGTSSGNASPFWACYSAYQSTQFGGSGVYAYGNGNERMSASYVNLDFATIWWMKEGATRPLLRSEARKYISNSHQLQLIELQRSANYTLLYNLDLTNDLVDNNAYYRNIWSGNGFVPIGVSGSGFAGSFDGNGKTINSLIINTPSVDRVGFIGTLSSGTIRNVTLTNANVTGNALVGQLVGINEGGSISQGHSSGTSNGNLHVGGLVGGAYGNSSISDSSSSGTVNNSGSRAGGLVGENFSSTSVIQRSYSTSTVNGSWLVGGLVGYQIGDIFDSYARGNVNGGTDAGGLIGRIDGGTVSRVYSSGRVSGTSGLGGLVGRKQGTSSFSSAYWELDNSNMSISAAGSSFTYSNKAKHSTYAGFDFTNIWGISVNRSYQDTYPELRSQTSSQYLQTPIYVKAIAGSSVYGETPAINYALSYQPDGAGQSVSGATITGAPNWSGSPTSASPASNYNLSYAGGLSIIFTSGYYAILTENPTTWLVNKRPVQLSAIAASKTYGNLDPALTLNVQATASGVGLISADTVTGSLARATGEGVGTYAISKGTTSVTNSTNYDVTFSPANLTITRRAISLAAQTAAKTYGDLDPALTATITSGSLGSVTVSDSLADLTGTLTRVSGESVGSYGISLGSGIKATNYDVTFLPANLSIGRRAVSLAAQATSKSYGDVDPGFSATVTAGSLGSATVTDSLVDIMGAASRSAGETVGDYPITFSPGPKAGNYDLSFIPANLTIQRRAVTLSAQSSTKTYGDTDPVLVATITAGSVGSATVSDSLNDLTGTLFRSPGESVGTYAISLGSGSKASNYDISFIPVNLNVVRRAINVSAQAASKRQGNPDPVLTYSHPSLYFGDTLSGALTRTSGESPGSYVILQGTLDDTRNNNYAITFSGSTFTISSSNTLYYGTTDSAKFSKIERNSTEQTIDREISLSVARGQLTPTADNRSNIYLIPADISPAPVNSASPLEVKDGGVRLPEGVTQSYYLKTSK